MKYSRLWVLSAIIVLVLLIGFVLSVPHTRDSGKVSLQTDEVIVPTVSFRDSFKKGVHTITGSMQAPNACTTVTAEASLVGEEAGTQEILVALTLPKDSGICLQVPTKVNFTTTVVAPARLPITATVNGAVATTTAS